MTQSDFVSTRSFGDVQVAVISAGELHYTPPFPTGLDWVTEDTVIDRDGLAVIGVNALYARVDTAVILVDPSTFGPDETLPRARLVAQPGIDGALAILDVKPAGITHVLVTHLHADHLNALTMSGTDGPQPRFPNAQHLVPARDWQEYIAGGTKEEAGELMQFLGPVRDAGLLHLVDPGHVLSERVHFIHTGGESPGHQAVDIDTGAGSLVYLGDLVHFPAEIAHFDWAGVRGRDPQELQAGRQLTIGAAPNDTTFVFTHGRFPAWGAVAPDGRGGRVWRYLD